MNQQEKKISDEAREYVKARGVLAILVAMPMYFSLRQRKAFIFFMSMRYNDI